MKNAYAFGEDFKMDELRARHNLSKVLKGKVKRKGNLTKKFTAWKTK